MCDLETSRMGAPHIYIYIYDISHLGVKRMNAMTNFLRNIKIMCYLDKIISQQNVISEALCPLKLIESL